MRQWKRETGVREAVKEGEEADGRSEKEGRTVKPFDNDGTYAVQYLCACVCAPHLSTDKK